MFRKVLLAKIHRARVTHANLDYEGSVTLAPELLSAAGIAASEAVAVWNITRGTRFETYTIGGDPGSESVSINGAAAHLVEPGDLVIIAAFGYLQGDAVFEHRPTVVFVDERNRVVASRAEVPGPALRAHHG